MNVQPNHTTYMNTLNELKPEKIWFFFNEICKIPHPSKKEDKIRKWLVEFGRSRMLETIVDEAGSVLIRKPASAGKEKSPCVILQSHMDMVCEKNSATSHDFEVDPIRPQIDNGWVKATGTTLGADDGIGMAAQLALLDAKDISHGPIECFFTVDEETGLTGAFALKPDLLNGRILLNLDSEDEGQIFIGCAGGKDTTVKYGITKEKVSGELSALSIKVTGLKGGHSGDDINKGLGNAVKIITRLLWNLHSRFGIRISALDAGNLRNAIAREATAKFAVEKKHVSDLKKFVKNLSTAIKDELRINDPGLTIEISEIVLPESYFGLNLQETLLLSLYACPHGVIAMTPDMPGLVETSTNLASVKTTENEIVIQTSQRSSVDSSKEDIVSMVSSVFRLAGAEVFTNEGYPGWKPNLDSDILRIAKDAYQRLFDQTPSVLAIHAGLECGVIGEKYPGMDMISFGPTLKGVHSPDERLEIASVDKFWKLLLEILDKV